jgi:hypothetical protein
MTDRARSCVNVCNSRHAWRRRPWLLRRIGRTLGVLDGPPFESWKKRKKGGESGKAKVERRKEKVVA